MGTVFLNVSDAKLLGVHDITQKIKGKVKRAVFDEKTREFPIQEVEEEVDACTPERNEALDKIVGYHVNIGIARKMLKKHLNGRPLEGRRLPEVQTPQSEEVEDLELATRPA